MKKRILLIGLLSALLCATNMVAQETATLETEMTAAAKKAAKMTEKEAKRVAKETADAEKELAKLEKAEADAERRKERRDKNQEKFDQFMAKWEPVDVSDMDVSKMPNTIEFFKQSNDLFAKMKEIENYVGFIQIEALPEDEEGIVEMKVTNKNTGADIAKNDALDTYTQATLDLTTAALTAANVTLTGTSSLLEFASNPFEAFALGKKVKDTLSAVKYSTVAIPLIKAKIADNTAALKQSKNN